jgi:hypothetical protein
LELNRNQRDNQRTNHIALYIDNTLRSEIKLFRNSFNVFSGTNDHILIKDTFYAPDVAIFRVYTTWKSENSTIAGHENCMGNIIKNIP